jgi:hypothetical protein
MIRLSMNSSLKEKYTYGCVTSPLTPPQGEGNLCEKCFYTMAPLPLGEGPGERSMLSLIMIE